MMTVEEDKIIKVKTENYSNGYIKFKHEFLESGVSVYTEYHEEADSAGKIKLISFQAMNGKSICDSYYTKDGLAIRYEEKFMGVKHGSYEEWHVGSSQKKHLFEYKAGKLNGVQLTFDENGTTISNEEYENGVLVKKTI